MSINAYPLQWPAAWPRTEAPYRAEARFAKARQQQSHGGYVAGRKLTLNEALERALSELQRMGIDRQDIVGLRNNVWKPA